MILTTVGGSLFPPSDFSFWVNLTWVIISGGGVYMREPEVLLVLYTVLCNTWQSLCNTILNQRRLI